MRKWLYCILLTAMVLPMVSCRRAVEKARRNIRLEAVEKVERKGMGGAEAVAVSYTHLTLPTILLV